MPELPEVETIAKQLNNILRGQTIKWVRVRRSKSFQGKPKSIVGKKIKSVGRRAKIVIFKLSGELNLLVHLKMTGQLIYQQRTKGKGQRAKLEVQFKDHKSHFRVDGRIVGGHPTADWLHKLPSSHTRVVMKLSKGTLFFNDMRVFGWVKVVEERDLEEEFENYGPDIIDRKVTKKYFYRVLQKTGRAVKLVIMDQKKMAGVGNIYANDGLFCAGIDPRRVSKEIARLKSDKLLDCLRKVIRKGIRYGGATASDDKFVQTTGLGGKYQEHFLVYEREGEKCKTRGCVGVVKKIKLGARGTYFCSVCQR